MILSKPIYALTLFVSLVFSQYLWSQTPVACTTLGQTPSTAFPVCGTSTFTQTTVPLCETNSIFVPGCTGDGAGYANKNPFFYKFTCFVSGTLGFIINPLAANEDYDWQLWDITGHNPDDIFTDPSLVVTGNWAGTYAATGTSATGVTGIQCASDPAANLPTFTEMPNIIVGHEYLLMVSHFTDGQSGYTLDFTGGTAVITDPKEPHLESITPDCDGVTLRLKLNKKMKCSSLTPNGNEFSISPAAPAIVSVTTNGCSSGFDFDEIVIKLANRLPNNNYVFSINDGTDGNSLLDICNRNIPNETLPFFYAIPDPIFADSIGRVGCAPDSIKIYFPKKITCSTIPADGSDFTVSGPSPVTVISAYGDCIDGFSDYIVLKFASPVTVKGNYIVTLHAATDGSPVLDECNIGLPVHQRPFLVPADTVNANFTYATEFGCQENSVLFSHDGAHDVNNWTWIFNNTDTFHTQTHSAVFSSHSTNTIQLIVSNGVCSDTASASVVMDNEVNADFEIPDIICPEDSVVIINKSTGQIDRWNWSFDIAGTSTEKDPAPVHYPYTNIETMYTIKLVAINDDLGCSDSLRKRVKVLNNCFIAVPTAFTPNNDGLNDFLYPYNAIKAENLKFSVYNRWGQLVFTSNDWRMKWDGKVNGIPQGTGVFVWFLSYTHRDTRQKVFQKGTVTLIR